MSHDPVQRPARKGRALVRAGFTLLELVIVLAIIAIAAAIAVPRWASSHQARRVEVAAVRVCADIVSARELACASSARVAVEFTDGSSSYRVRPAAPGGAGGFVTSLAQPPYEAWIASPKFGSGTSLEFNALGVPTSPGVVHVRTQTLLSIISVDSSGTCTSAPPVSVTRGQPTEAK
ncbi:MAG: prepilin-type N-terminal cleavage/methylation domain-containing protein [Leptolyngbya sp. PLA1]|nr:prepilin-type N-terminal cleavage/methylation domain-containing protein [Leptolyngbya sp. PLA1]